MRKQIRGLDQASTNAEDGVSAVQTAEGALTEVHSMLQRMNELAVQAANGTNSKDTDRKAIQDEIDQLNTEIDRVAETTKFNEIYLLKGDDGEKTINLKAHDAGLKGTLTDNGDGTATFTMKELNDGDTVSIGGKAYCDKNGCNTNYCFLVDFSIHSGKRRFFVWDFKGDSVKYASLCAHGYGKNSTLSKPVFSNVEGSYCSSLGKYKVGIRSYSKWGINVHYKLHGLEVT